VTSQGTARAARIHAEASMHAQQLSRVREIRYAGSITGELYYRLGDVYAQLTDAHARLARLDQLRIDLRDAFDPFNAVPGSLSSKGRSPSPKRPNRNRAANPALWMVSQGEPGARERFDEAHRIFRGRLEGFAQARTRNYIWNDDAGGQPAPDRSGGRAQDLNLGSCSVALFPRPFIDRQLADVST
jgi:hypothetical protein